MEKYVNKSAAERFTPLAVCTAIAGGGMFAAIKFGNAAEKAQNEGKRTKASILSTASTICGWAAGLTAVFGLPNAVGDAINGKKPSPEYKKELERVDIELTSKINLAEAQYQAAVQQACNEANERLIKL